MCLIVHILTLNSFVHIFRVDLSFEFRHLLLISRCFGGKQLPRPTDSNISPPISTDGLHQSDAAGSWCLPGCLSGCLPGCLARCHAWCLARGSSQSPAAASGSDTGHPRASSTGCGSGTAAATSEPHPTHGQLGHSSDRRQPAHRPVQKRHRRPAAACT